MHKQKVPALIFLFLLCVSLKSYAQITATPAQGCAPLNVFFSGPAGAASPSWSFGLGQGTSLLSNPSYPYVNAGTYNITYTAVVGGNPVNYVTTVTVYPNPSGSFNYSLPPSHCAPMTVTYTATGPAGSNFTFFFGDLTSGTGSPITHTYGFPGNFIPQLTITDSHGCTNPLPISNGTIHVSSQPNMVINANPGLSSCTFPFTTSFSSNGSSSGSPTSSSLTCQWTFGNSTPPSTQPNPPPVTYGQGEFTVTLKGTDNNSCSNTTSAVVSVVQPIVTATLPPVVCVGDSFLVTVNSLPAITMWQMGNGGQTAFNDSNPTGPTTKHLYYVYPPGSGGTKTITIQAVLGTCVYTLSKVITVEEIVPQFTFAPTSPTISCNSPMLAPLINQSTVNTGATLSYFWQGPNPNGLLPQNHFAPPTSTVTNPTFTLSQGSFNPYVVYQMFTPNVLLTVVSVNGCTANINHNYHFLQRPTAWFNKDKKEGCAPLVVTFRDSSRVFTDPNNPPNFSITSYTWNNGANPPVLQTGVTSPSTYTVPPFTYTYTTAGTYTPFLTIQTFGGCTDVSFIDTVVVSGPPNISLGIAPNLTVCAGVTPVSVTLQAVPGQTVQHWHVASDNNFYSGCVNNSMPSFPFTHTGIHNFTVTGYQFGCASPPLVTTQSVTVYGPYSQFRFQTNCANTSSVNFYSYLQDVQTATLNFGDGTFQTFTGNVGGTASYSAAHIYTPTPMLHDYTVSLVSVNASHACAQQTYTQAVHIRHAQAAITNSLGLPLPSLPNPFVCARDSIKLKATISTDVASWCYADDYSWFFYSSNPAETLRVSVGYDTVVTRIPSAGIYTVVLKVRDINGCLSTDTKQIRVSDANPAFSFNANPICLSDNPVVITNNTSQVPNDVNANFWWTFGDGSSVVAMITTQTVSHSYNPSFVIPPFAYFYVKLVAKNSFGCKDSVTHPLTVNNPNAFFSPFPNPVCVPDNVVFTGSAGYTSYNINYSDSTAGSLTKPNNVFKHKYLIPGNHTATLTVTDAAGCINSQTLPPNNIIRARVKPSASFTTLGIINYCSPASITFTSTSTTTDPVYSSITNYIWDLGTGPFATNTPSAVNVFTNTGVTNISLIVYPDGIYCADTATMNISVYNTQGTLALNKTKFCVGQTITASIINRQDVSNWQCNVGFGIQPSPTPLAPTQSVSYTYTNTTQTGTVDVTAIISSPNGACTITVQKTIEIIEINPEFKRNLEQTLADTVHCLRIPDQFTHGVNTASTNINYNWSFGDGSTSLDPNPLYTYPTAGVWHVTLAVNAPDFGCQRSSIKDMTINPLPTATLASGINCPDKPFLINVETSQGVISGTWSPIENIVDSAAIFTPTSSVFTTSAIANATTNFSLTVTDINNCVSDEVVKQIEVLQPPPSIHWDTTIVIGQTVALNSNLGSNYTYTWTPIITDLSCQTCPVPVSSTTANITYSVQVEDYLHCAATVNTYSIIVEPLSTIDVPTAFTPNGDGVNEVIYVAGWGIKKLNYFRVYNRWGQMLFETNDIKQGWDGVYNGVPQNMETYVYQISIDSYVDTKPILKTGTFKLLR